MCHLCAQNSPKKKNLWNDGHFAPSAKRHTGDVAEVA